MCSLLAIVIVALRPFFLSFFEKFGRFTFEEEDEPHLYKKRRL
jgi:hypothetical protein